MNKLLISIIILILGSSITWAFGINDQIKKLSETDVKFSIIIENQGKILDAITEIKIKK